MRCHATPFVQKVHGKKFINNNCQSAKEKNEDFTRKEKKCKKLKLKQHMEIGEV